MLSYIFGFFVVSCAISVVLFILACYYLTYNTKIGIPIENYTRYEVFIILLTCVFWWIPSLVLAVRVSRLGFRPMVDVFNYILGEKNA